MWHGAMVDGFEEHFTPVFKFTKNTDSDWALRVTLLYWEVAKRPSDADLKQIQEGQGADPEDARRFAERHQQTDFRAANAAFWTYFPAAFSKATQKPLRGSPFPPDNLGREQESKPRRRPNVRRRSPVPDDDGLFKHARYIISSEPDATTLVISANQLGDFGICSLVSKLVPETAMTKFAQNAFEIWSMFAARPQTARCLFFIVLLGINCGEIARRYEKIVSVVEDALKFKVNAFPASCFRFLRLPANPKSPR
jgi:hypothetical protein